MGLFKGVNDGVSLLLAALLSVFPNLPNTKIFEVWVANNSSFALLSSSGKMNICIDLWIKVFYSVDLANLVGGVIVEMITIGNFIEKTKYIFGW